MLIEKSLDVFLDEALPLTMPTLGIYTINCPSCNSQVRFPIVARQRDIEAMQRLIDFIIQFGEGVGSMENLMESVLANIKERLNIQ